MSKLLRLANECLEAKRRGYSMNPAVDFENACTVIEGYQDLIRRMLPVLEACESYVDGLGNLGDEADAMLAEARASIPEQE